jgi:hypothetical protein
LGDRDQAIASCGGALVLDGVRMSDYAHYVHLVLSKPGPLADEEQATLRGIVSHLANDKDAHPLSDQLQCEVGERVGNLADLEACTPVFVAQEPNSVRTLGFQFALAMKRGNFAEARLDLDRAKKAGMPDEAFQAREKDLVSASHHRYWGAGFALLAAGLAAAGLGFLIRYLLGLRRSPAQQQPA